MHIEWSSYFPQILATIASVLIAIVLRVSLHKLINKYGVLSSISSARLAPILRVCSISINLLLIAVLVTIWGVNKQNIFVALSSVFAVIGVALFAQWSILSNVTAGFIVFFNSPFKVGDYIKIQDKDFPMEAKIVNVLTFYTYLQTDDGQVHIYPNNLFLQKGISIIKRASLNK